MLDILRDPQWPADYITDDPDEFLDVFWDSQECMAFIDEAGEAVGRYNEAMTRTATRGRHRGHVVHYIAQKGTQIAPLVRDQCTGLFLFSSSVRDGKILAEEFGHNELESCNLLKTGEYYHARKMGPCSRSSLFGDTNDRTDSARNNRPLHDGNGNRDDGKEKTDFSQPAEEEGRRTAGS